VRRIALLALLVSAVAAGCGGGAEDSPTTQVTGQQSVGPPTRADYIELADAICRNHRSRREDLESQAAELGSIDSRAKARQIAELLRQESANRRDELAELRGLSAPAGDSAGADAFLALVEGEAELIDRWADAYDNADAAAIRELQIRLGAATARAAKSARVYGLDVCGQQ
jgi:hypothetical protein